MHVHYAIPHAATAWLAKQMLRPERDLKVVTTLHGTDITLVGQDPSYYTLTKFSIEQSDAVTAVSTYLRDETYRAFGCVDCDVRVIPNFVSQAEYHPPRDGSCRGSLAPAAHKILIHVSNFRPVKRVRDVVAIFAAVRKAIPATLILVGDGPDRDAVEQESDRLGLGSDVRFFGKVDQVGDLLRGSDLFLLPSETESFGLAALEAMACGGGSGHRARQPRPAAPRRLGRARQSRVQRRGARAGAPQRRPGSPGHGGFPGVRGRGCGRRRRHARGGAGARGRPRRLCRPRRAAGRRAARGSPERRGRARRDAAARVRRAGRGAARRWLGAVVVGQLAAAGAGACGTGHGRAPRPRARHRSGNRLRAGEHPAPGARGIRWGVLPDCAVRAAHGACRGNPADRRPGGRGQRGGRGGPGEPPA